MNRSATPSPRAGEVWWIQFSPQIGREQSGLRPGLVISSDDYNQLPHGLVIVVPMTTKDRQLPAHVRIDPPEAGLRQPGYCMCEQIKSISVDRLDRRQGAVGQSTLSGVRDTVSRFLQD